MADADGHGLAHLLQNKPARKPRLQRSATVVCEQLACSTDGRPIAVGVLVSLLQSQGLERLHKPLFSSGL